jgi:hypothetical protein
MTATVNADEPRSSAPCAHAFFDAVNGTDGARVFWELCGDSPVTLNRRGGDGKVTVLRTENTSVAASLPWHVEVLRRGSYFFLSVNEQKLSWVNHPAADIDCKNSVVLGDEPLVGEAGVLGNGLAVSGLAQTCISWEQDLPTAPVLSHGGGNGSWYEGQLFPGAVLTVNGTHYLYVCGSDLVAPGEESGGHVRVGVAVSTDPELKHWQLHPEPVLDLGKAGDWDSANVFVNGAVVAPDGRVALTFAGDGDGKGLTWGGIGVAFGRGPLGPFEKSAANPVLRLGAKGRWDAGAIHEHVVVKLPAPGSASAVAAAGNYSYAMLYTGFPDRPPYGDQGGLAFSDDLLVWSRYGGNPVLRHDPDADNWDSAHRRPRSLDLIDGVWYLLYEGANAVRHGCYRDSVGLARSTDLLSWGTHPLRVAVPQQAGGRFDAVWTGWPRAVVGARRGVAHILHAAGGNDMVDRGTRHFATTGLRTVPLQRYAEWTLV